MNEQILVVNENDEVIGLNTKENCHAGQGILHRAITIFVFNDKNEILLTKRSALKKLWPNFWDTSCSTHLRPGETNEQAGEKRLNEEIGFSFPLKPLLKFQYRINFKNIGSEYELCHLLIRSETNEQAGEKRLNEEIGFSCPLKPLLKFQYRINFKNIGSEYELCHLLI